MTSKTVQEDVELLEHSRTNALNECIEQIRNEPEISPLDPPPSYEEACSARQVENPKDDFMSKHSVLITRITTPILISFELMITMLLIFLIFGKNYFNYLPALTIRMGSPILIITILLCLCLLIVIYLKKIKLYIYYMVLGTIRCCISFVGVFYLTEDLKTTNQYEERLSSNIAELEKEANGYADQRDLLSPVINYKSVLSKNPSFPSDKEKSPSYNELEARYNESSRLYNETQNKIKLVQEKISLVEIDENNIRTLLVTLVILCLFGAVLLLLVYQIYQMKKNEKRYKNVNDENENV